MCVCVCVCVLGGGGAEDLLRSPGLNFLACGSVVEVSPAWFP